MTARRAVAALGVLAVALGVFARLDLLGYKLLWQDEAFSLLRISGHTNAELDARFDGTVQRAADIFALQEVTPARGVPALLASIISEEPQRGPLYYVLARGWIGLAGNGTAAVRGLSALLGIAGIALAFGFGCRAAGSRAGGIAAAATFALAPLQIRYAQQVREYVLVADLTLLSGWLLLRAFDKPAWPRWLAFGLCAALGLYANVEFAFVLAVEAATVAALAWREAAALRRARVGGVLAALAGALAAYAPWFTVVAAGARRGASDVSWAGTPYSLRSALVKWTFNVGASFFDSEYAHVSLGVALIAVVFLLALAAWRLLAGPGAPFARALALALALSSALPLALLDALRHAHFALVTRYAISSWTGLEVAVGLAVASLAASETVRDRRLGAAAMGLIVFLGASAIVLDRPYVEWWDDNEHLSERAVADAVAAAPEVPIVADNGTEAYVLVLSRYLAPQRELLLVRDRLRALPAGPRAYLFLPGQELRARALALDGSGARLDDVSPPIGLTIPDLRAEGEPRIEAGNALWLLQRASNRK